MTVWYEGMPIPDKRLLPPQRRRIWELDFLRGVFILLMVMDHTFFDIGYPYMFGEAWLGSGNAAAVKMVEFCRFYWDHPVREWVHDMVLWGFFLLCGMSVAFSRNNYVHSAKIGLCAVILTCGTLLAEAWGVGTGIAIRFGVLHMLAVCSMLVALVYGVVRRHRLLQIYVFFRVGAVFLPVRRALSRRARLAGRARVALRHQRRDGQRLPVYPRRLFPRLRLYGRHGGLLEVARRTLYHARLLGRGVGAFALSRQAHAVAAARPRLAPPHQFRRAAYSVHRHCASGGHSLGAGPRYGVVRHPR